MHTKTPSDVYYHQSSASPVISFGMSRQKMHYARIIFLTSLFWVLVDAFLVIYMTDCSSSLSRLQMPCDQQVQHLELRIATLQRRLNKYEKAENKEEKQENEDYEEALRLKNERLHKIHELRNHELLKGQPVNKEQEYFREEYANEPTNPISWPGENGRGVIIPSDLKEKSEKRFKENQFNIVASDLIALNRSVPDQRSEACKNREYPLDLPTTSIIIVHHNEANTTLLRGLMSIIRKSPLRYIKEIILVDDASEGREYLGKPLDDFVKRLPVPVKIMRNKQRLGLIRSRLRGADAATGDTMTFLDAHIEATNGWLPPLLNEIKMNRKTVACPVIDVISDENFQYMTGSEMTYGGFDSHVIFDWVPVPERENQRRQNDMSKPLRKAVASPIIDVIKDDDFSYLTGSEGTYGGFNEKLNFRWIPIPKRENLRRYGDKSLAARTPAMAGGLFTIDRKYFYEVGTYDEGMDIWGAENIEMSFRIWMCGGTLLVLPCSHVGHVFRKQTPYSFPGGTNKIIFRNNRRLIDVWTDDYKEYFHRVVPDINTVEAGDLSKRIQLKNDLNCKSFQWYLENIYPEAPVPVNFFHVGDIQNTGVNFCLDSMGRKAGEDVGASYCHHQGGNQIFEYSKNFQIIYGSLCLDTVGSLGAVKMNTCTKPSKSQEWDYDNINEYFRNRETASCLTINELNNNLIQTVSCNPKDPNQKWTFSNSIFKPKEESE